MRYNLRMYAKRSWRLLSGADFQIESLSPDLVILRKLYAVFNGAKYRVLRPQGNKMGEV
jgi:hypothetical protein